MAQTMAVLKGQNGQNILLIDVELHDDRGQTLYALCTPNDVVSPKAQQWQLADLLTADALCHLLGITEDVLPRGVRAISPQFAKYRTISTESIRATILKRESRRKPMRYQHLKNVKTSSRHHRVLHSKGSALTVEFWAFYEAVNRALADEQVDLIPIVSLTKIKGKRKQKVDHFSVDYLLPVQMGANMVGVVYRNTECTLTLMDGYDISNKAVLCNPSFDVQAFKWTENSYDRLRVVSADQMKVNMSPTLSAPALSDTASMRSMVSTPQSLRPESPEVPSLSLSAYSVQTPQSTPNPMCSFPIQYPMAYADSSKVSPLPVQVPVPVPVAVPQLIVERVGMSEKQLMEWTNAMIQNTLQCKAVLDGVHLKNKEFQQSFNFSSL